MSQCDLEEYFHDYHKLANKGSRVNAVHRMRCDRFPGKKDADKVIVAKSIYDPQNTLSKRRRRRLHADRSDGFCTGVPYSMNKQGRWKIADPAALLMNRPSSDYELCVVHREVTIHDDDVTHMHAIHDGNVLAVCSAGRKKSIRHFIKQLNEKRGIEKEEVEPARILFNIVNPPRLTHLKTKELKYERVFRLDDKTRLTNDRNKWANCDIEVSADMSMSTEGDSDADYDDLHEPTRNGKLTLGDFVSSKQPSTSSHRVRPRLSKSSEVNSPSEIISTKPANMVDISGATNSPHIFEIIDVRLNSLDGFNLKQEITLLLPGYCTVRWFSSERLSISSNKSVLPVFVLFFGVLPSHGILRIRISMKAQNSPKLDKEALVNLLGTRKNFPSLFEDLIEFIFSLEPCTPSEREPSRYSTCKDGFPNSANSKRMTGPTVESCEHDQLDFMRFYYMGDDSKPLPELADETLCSICRCPYEPDLFLSTEGMMCRQCVASLVIRQLRLNHIPIEIPLITPCEVSPVDLLYAILPLPLMSLFLEKSYTYYCSLLYPQARMVQCPQCSTSLLVTEHNEFNCCMCSSCGCCWCYLCNWEAHWPMTCEEFKKWSEKWDIQYFFDKFNLDEGERVLRVQCRCGNIIHAPENSAHGTLCTTTKCWHQYDKNGLMRHSRGLFFPYRPMHRKKYHHPDSEFYKSGLRVYPEYLAPKKLIKKRYAATCLEARKLRLDEEKRIMFADCLSNLFPSESERSRMLDMGQTILFLVENCTAWLYLHRSDDHRHSKRTVSSLFQHFLVFHERILSNRSGDKISPAVLEARMSDVIGLFRRLIDRP
ncbi:hypothetical protein Aduo_008084 [Ancylostoma duodenale]